jgi:hypothetical protein
MQVLESFGEPLPSAALIRGDLTDSQATEMGYHLVPVCDSAGADRLLNTRLQDLLGASTTDPKDPLYYSAVYPGIWQRLQLDDCFMQVATPSRLIGHDFEASTSDTVMRNCALCHISNI